MSSTTPVATEMRVAPKNALGGLHRVHWAVVGASLVLTFVASWITAKNADQRQRSEFEQEAEQAVGLVLERMEKYEGGLWAGVILHVPAGELDAYNDKWQAQYPEIEGFSSKPQVLSSDHFPITFIEPLETNKKALGLDMAFETERHNGAMRTMRTGMAQVTGPIVLVQDAGKTPGFLFFAPFYRDGEKTRTLEDLEGMVYAPFVVKQLMAGTRRRCGSLRRRNRNLPTRRAGAVNDESRAGIRPHMDLRHSFASNRDRTSELPSPDDPGVRHHHRRVPALHFCGAVALATSCRAIGANQDEAAKRRRATSSVDQCPPRGIQRRPRTIRVHCFSRPASANANGWQLRARTQGRPRWAHQR